LVEYWQGIKLKIKRSWVQLPVGLLLSKISGQVVHTYMPLSAGSIILYQPSSGDIMCLGIQTT